MSGNHKRTRNADYDHGYYPILDTPTLRADNERLRRTLGYALGQLERHGKDLWLEELANVLRAHLDVEEGSATSATSRGHTSA